MRSIDHYGQAALDAARARHSVALYQWRFVHRTSDEDRSTPDATHAWLETYLRSLGWVGCDPTNSVLAGERQIRVADGRDYSDVPPTRGVFKGVAESELNVEVHITSADKPFELQSLMPRTGWTPDPDELRHTQQQQQ